MTIARIQALLECLQHRETTTVEISAADADFVLTALRGPGEHEDPRVSAAIDLFSTIARSATEQQNNNGVCLQLENDVQAGRCNDNDGAVNNELTDDPMFVDGDLSVHDSFHLSLEGLHLKNDVQAERCNDNDGVVNNELTDDPMFVESDDESLTDAKSECVARGNEALCSGRVSVDCAVPYTVRGNFETLLESMILTTTFCFCFV